MLFLDIFAICDAASISRGKVSLIGTYDTISSKAFPTIHQFFHAVVKLRSEGAGSHVLRIDVIDPDGRLVVACDEEKFEMNDNDTFHFLWRRAEMEIAKPGDYNVNLVVDSQVISSLPLRINLEEEQPAQGS
jgi:hypothetical protein